MDSNSLMCTSPSAFGGTKSAEYERSVDCFEQLIEADVVGQGPYFALALLYDSQYNREDIGEMLMIMQRRARDAKVQRNS